jgi:hypothetical protein
LGKLQKGGQYGDFVTYEAGGYHEAKKILKQQIEHIFPKKNYTKITWIRLLDTVYHPPDGGVYEISKRKALKRGRYILAWKTTAT